MAVPEAPVMRNFFCERISLGEYEDQCSMETETALKDLVSYLEQNADEYHRVLLKRKHDEIQDGGMFSMLKGKVLESIQGDQYVQGLVTAEESQLKLDELKNGIMMTLSSQQEQRGPRFSRRLAAKRFKSDFAVAAQRSRSEPLVKSSGDDDYDVRGTVRYLENISPRRPIVHVTAEDCRKVIEAAREESLMQTSTVDPASPEVETPRNYDDVQTTLPRRNKTRSSTTAPSSREERQTPSVEPASKAAAGGTCDDVQTPVLQEIKTLSATTAPSSARRPMREMDSNVMTPYNRRHSFKTPRVCASTKALPSSTLKKRRRYRNPLPSVRRRYDVNGSVESLAYTNPLDSSEPLSSAFMRILDDKMADSSK